MRYWIPFVILVAMLGFLVYQVFAQEEKATFQEKQATVREALERFTGVAKDLIVNDTDAVILLYPKLKVLAQREQAKVDYEAYKNLPEMSPLKKEIDQVLDVDDAIKKYLPTPTPTPYPTKTEPEDGVIEQ